MNTQVSNEGADAMESIGQQLRHARIAKGYSIADIAARMRVLSRVIEDIESEHYDRLGAPIYVRGHLQSYCRELGLPCELANGCAGTSAPPLAPMVRSSMLQRLLEFSTRSLVYVVLTASIGIPVVWFALSAPGVQQAHSLTRIDPLSPALNTGDNASSSAAGAAFDAGPVVTSATPSEQPVVASLAGFYSDSPAADTVAQAPATLAASGAEADSGLALRFEKKSWLQIRSRDGTLRDEALIGGGEERRYPLAQVGYVTLGNASGVVVSIDGVATDISAFQHADVARFAISSDGALAPARE